MASYIDIYRGDNKTITVIVKKPDGSIVPINGANIIFSVKKKLSDTDYTFQKTSAQTTEIDLTDPDNGEFEIYVLSADTENKPPGDYEFDCQIILSGLKSTILRGIFEIKSEVTRP